MRLQRRCVSSSSTPEMSKQWLGSATDRANLLRKWAQPRAAESASPRSHLGARRYFLQLRHDRVELLYAQVSMAEDAACVEMSLVREQKTTFNNTRKIMTVADMQMANMSPRGPQLASIGRCVFANMTPRGPQFAQLLLSHLVHNRFGRHSNYLG